jgi:L-seryl-tRNA(Ser) seleniumtransferase
MLDGRAEQEIPVLRSMLTPLDALEARTREMAVRLQTKVRKKVQTEARAASKHFSFDLVRDRVPLGGGTLPGFELDTWVLAIRSSAGGARQLSSTLRSGAVPVLARTRDDALLVDLRTVGDEDQRDLEDAIVAALR